MKRVILIFLILPLLAVADPAAIANRIVKSRLSLVPISGVKYDESELGRTKFLQELLNKKNEDLMILYVLMLAEADQQLRDSDIKPEKRVTGGVEWVTVPICSKEDLEVLRKYARSTSE